MILVAIITGLVIVVAAEHMFGPLNYGVRGVLFVIGTVLGILIQQARILKEFLWKRLTMYLSGERS